MAVVQDAKELVRRRYGAFAAGGGHREALSDAGGPGEACCAAQASASGYALDQGLYSEAELAVVPDLALDLSRGCGNPSGFAQLGPGEVVVDFGCGGGIDVILAAQKVGPTGRVVGVDFAAEMVARANEGVEKAGVAGAVELRLADLTNTGLPDASADVVISNCVINLCPDKEAAYREAFRILRPGGRLAISDVIYTEALPDELQDRFQADWTGCLAGSWPEHDYLEMVRASGFADLAIVACHLLSPPEVEAMACCPGPAFTTPPAPEDLAAVQGKLASVKFRAVKPS